MLDHLVATSGIVVLLAVLCALAVFRFLRHLYRHETMPQFASALASLIITVLFSVFLNNLFALKRERDGRWWSLRDQHFAQLKVVLRAESERLHQVAEQVQKQAAFNSASSPPPLHQTHDDVAKMIWPDVLSPDLQNHFPYYDRDKKHLQNLIDSQDEQFVSTMSEIRLSVRKHHPNQWANDLVSLSIVQQCLGHGDGVKLVVTDSGYSFSAAGGSVGASGGASPPRPSADQVAAYESFRWYRPSATVISGCKELRARGDEIIEYADKLSKQALLLADGTNLGGNCEFMRKDEL